MRFYQNFMIADFGRKASEDLIFIVWNPVFKWTKAAQSWETRCSPYIFVSFSLFSVKCYLFNCLTASVLLVKHLKWLWFRGKAEQCVCGNMLNSVIWPWSHRCLCLAFYYHTDLQQLQQTFISFFSYFKEDFLFHLNPHKTGVCVDLSTASVHEGGDIMFSSQPYLQNHKVWTRIHTPKAHSH